MEKADVAFVYYNPEVIQHKRLKDLNSEEVKRLLEVIMWKFFTDSALLQSKLRSMNFDNSALLFMTSGNFSGGESD